MFLFHFQAIVMLARQIIDNVYFYINMFQAFSSVWVAAFFTPTCVPFTRTITQELKGKMTQQKKKRFSLKQCFGSVTFLIRIRASDQWIRLRVLLFSYLTFKTATKNYFFCLLLFEGTFTSFF